MHCEQIEMQLPLLVLDELEDAQKTELMAHLSQCAACSEKLGDLRVTMNLLREGAAALPAPVLSEQRRAKLMKKLAGKPKARKTKKRRSTRPRGPLVIPEWMRAVARWRRPIGIAAGLAVMMGVGAAVLTMTSAGSGDSAREDYAMAKAAPMAMKDGSSSLDDSFFAGRSVGDSIERDAAPMWGDRAGESLAWSERPVNRWSTADSNENRTFFGHTLHDGRRDYNAPAIPPSLAQRGVVLDVESTTPDDRRLATFTARTELESLARENTASEMRSKTRSFGTNGNAPVEAGYETDEAGALLSAERELGRSASHGVLPWTRSKSTSRLMEDAIRAKDERDKAQLPDPDVSLRIERESLVDGTHWSFNGTPGTPGSPGLSGRDTLPPLSKSPSAGGAVDGLSDGGAKSIDDPFGIAPERKVAPPAKSESAPKDRYAAALDRPASSVTPVSRNPAPAPLIGITGGGSRVESAPVTEGIHLPSIVDRPESADGSSRGGQAGGRTARPTDEYRGVVVAGDPAAPADGEKSLYYRTPTNQSQPASPKPVEYALGMPDKKPESRPGEPDGDKRGPRFGEGIKSDSGALGAIDLTTRNYDIKDSEDKKKSGGTSKWFDDGYAQKNDDKPADPRSLAGATGGGANGPVTKEGGETAQGIKVTGATSIVQFRADESQPWQAVKPGMEIPAGSELRTGLKSQAQLDVNGKAVNIDRLGVVKLPEAGQPLKDSLTREDVGLKYGRTRFDVEAGEHDSKVHTPGTTLAVRGTTTGAGFDAFDDLTKLKPGDEKTADAGGVAVKGLGEITKGKDDKEGQGRNDRWGKELSDVDGETLADSRTPRLNPKGDPAAPSTGPSTPQGTLGKLNISTADTTLLALVDQPRGEGEEDEGKRAGVHRLTRPPEPNANDFTRPLDDLAARSEELKIKEIRELEKFSKQVEQKDGEEKVAEKLAELQKAKIELAVIAESRGLSPEFIARPKLRANDEAAALEDKLKTLGAMLDESSFTLRRSKEHPAVKDLTRRIAETKSELAKVREANPDKAESIIELESKLERAQADPELAAKVRRIAELESELATQTQRSSFGLEAALGQRSGGAAPLGDVPVVGSLARENLKTTAERQDEKDALIRSQKAEMERHQSVQRLLQRAQELRKNQDYDRALQLVNQALFLDPASPPAEAMKLMIEDTQIASKSREYMRLRNDRFAKHSMEMIEATIPYNELITYPSDWPQLTATRLGALEKGGGSDEINRRVALKLQDPIPVNFEGNKLVNVVDYFRNTTGVNFFVNWAALEKAGVEQDLAVTLKLNNVPAEQALKLAVKQASGAATLDPIESRIIDGVVHISTRSDLADVTVRRMYDAREVLGVPGDEESAIRVAQRQTEVGDLVNTIKKELGKGDDERTFSIREVDGKLIIRASEADHQAVSALLKKITAQNAAANAGAVRAADAQKDDGAPLQPAASFPAVPVNPWTLTAQDAQSTFALDVDTAAYTLGRKYIHRGYLPPAGSVRMEEYINNFDYNYPAQADNVFNIHCEAAPAPFAPAGAANTALLKVGVKGKVVGRDGRKPANLVFVVDTSGSMARADRLPLVQHSLELLTSQLSPHDSVSLVTFGSQVVTLLDGAKAGDKEPINSAIRSLQPSGPTNLLKGVEAGYKVARQLHQSGAINRVILCSDGIATLGETEADSILSYVDQYRKQGISCTTIGFGAGAYDDDMMEKLANKGDGAYYFVDSKREAQRVFVDELTATLQTIAKDAKIQVEFNPQRVRRYRLIGYENRAVADKDFRNDAIDAGEVGSGQSSTALYEVELVNGDARVNAADLGTVYVRYRNADTEKVEEISQRLTADLVRERSVKDSPRLYLAACAAEFAEVLRESEHAQGGSLAKLRDVLAGVTQQLPLDEKAAELLDLVRKAQGLPRAP